MGISLVIIIIKTLQAIIAENTNYHNEASSCHGDLMSEISRQLAECVLLGHWACCYWRHSVAYFQRSVSCANSLGSKLEMFHQAFDWASGYPPKSTFSALLYLHCLLPSWKVSGGFFHQWAQLYDFQKLLIVAICFLLNFLCFYCDIKLYNPP